MTCDTWRKVNLLLTFQLSSSYGLGVKVVKDIFTKDELPNELMIKVFV